MRYNSCFQGGGECPPVQPGAGRGQPQEDGGDEEGRGDQLLGLGWEGDSSYLPAALVCCPEPVLA